MRDITSKIIVIDDDRGVRELFIDLFEDTFDISATESAEEVIEMISNENVAIVIVDHHMPRVTGIDLVKKIAEVSPLTRRVMMTGDKSKDIIIDAINTGHLHGFYNKPINFKDLHNDLEKHIAEYKKAILKEKELEIAREELIKLREALHSHNPKIFDTFKMVSSSEAGSLQESIDTFIRRNLERLSEQIQKYRKDNSDKVFAKLQELTQNIQMVSDEFGLKEGRVISLYFNLMFHILRENYDKIPKTISQIEGELSVFDDSKNRENLMEKFDRLLEFKMKIGLIEHDELISEIFDFLELFIANTKMYFDDVDSTPKNYEDKLLDNLGYFLVIKDHVTVYSKSFNPKTQVEPSLIGNLAIALNEFSHELFLEQSRIQILDQENGKIMIHKADKNIFYVAIAYTESYIYQIWLKEFATQSLNEFQKERKGNRYTVQDQSRLDSIIDDIVFSKVG